MIKMKNADGKKKYRTFVEMYPYCAFALAMGLLYPNPNNTLKRRFLASVIVLLNVPALTWFLINIVECVQHHDWYNLIRHLTIGTLVVLFFFKLFYINLITKIYKLLLDKISSDLDKGNEKELDYQEICDDYIKQAKKGEFCWVIIPIVMSSQIPIYAAVCTIVEYLKGGDRKFMVHEFNITLIEHKQYDSPYFEVLFLYNCFQSVVLMPNFGFDGSFCIATTHLRMKLKLAIHKLRKSFKYANNTLELQNMIKEVVRDHQDALKFYEDLQIIYGPWLLLVFLVTTFMISFNIYLLSLSDTIDPKGTIFAISGVVHMYTPCYYSSRLLEEGERLSIELYNAPWEEWGDATVTKLLIFMIARAQQPLLLTGQGMVYFNMELFVSILQTSYSFFTIITSGDDENVDGSKKFR